MPRFFLLDSQDSLDTQSHTVAQVFDSGGVRLQAWLQKFRGNTMKSTMKSAQKAIPVARWRPDLTVQLLNAAEEGDSQKAPPAPAVQRDIEVFGL